MRYKEPTDHILTANEKLLVREHGGYPLFVQHMANQRHPGARVNWQIRGKPLLARVWNGCLDVECQYCPEAMVYEPGLPFFCTRCLMRQNGGFAKSVQVPDGYPDDDPWRMIETILLQRPRRTTRAWYPHETAFDLLVENAEHGIGV